VATAAKLLPLALLIVAGVFRIRPPIWPDRAGRRRTVARASILLIFAFSASRARWCRA